MACQEAGGLSKALTAICCFPGHPSHQHVYLHSNHVLHEAGCTSLEVILLIFHTPRHWKVLLNYQPHVPQSTTSPAF